MTDFPPPFPPAAQPVQKPRRLRRFVFASALLVTGGVIGAVVAGPVLGQGGYGPPPWAHHATWAATACSSPARSSAASSGSAG